MSKQSSADTKSSSVSRRGFIKASAAVSAASLMASMPGAYAKGSDKIRVGLIGCGGRGTGAGIIDCAQSSKGVELVAMGDVFEDSLKRAPRTIKRNLERRGLNPDDIYKVTPETTFSGLDAYKKVIASDVDMVILTTPPYFRPAQFKAAVDAGKHVFVEKPIAVDPVGVRDFIKTAERAKEKKLCVVAGTQMRRARHIMATVERIHAGDMGDVFGGQVVRSSGGMLDWSKGTRERKPEWSDVEYQIRRWLFMTWLSGDFIVEMHVHNLDIMNWVMGSAPKQCFANGGREVRKDPAYGNVFDHFSVEYEYPNGGRIQYIGNQIDGVSGRNDLNFAGTKGKSFIDFGRAYIKGDKSFTYDGPAPNPAVQEYADLIAAIRNGDAINDGQQVAESTMTAILGRMSAYTGRALKWKWAMNLWFGSMYPMLPIYTVARLIYSTTLRLLRYLIQHHIWIVSSLKQRKVKF